MVRIKRFFAKLLLLCIILVPAFAAAAQEQERKDSALPDSIEFAVDEMIEEMVESAQPAADNALKYLELLSLVEPEHREGHNERGERRAKHEHRIGLFQVWRIMNEVELTDEQVDKFFPLWREVQKQERTLSTERRELVKELREELKKEKPDEAMLQRLVTMIRSKSERIWQVRKDGMDKAMDLLTVTQKARFLLSVSEAEKDIRESIFRVRSHLPHMPEAPIMPDWDSEEFQQKMQEFNEKMQRFNERIGEKSKQLQELKLDEQLKRAQMRLEEANKRLEEANKKKKDEDKK